MCVKVLLLLEDNAVNTNIATIVEYLLIQLYIAKNRSRAHLIDIAKIWFVTLYIALDFQRCIEILLENTVKFVYIIWGSF